MLKNKQLLVIILLLAALVLGVVLCCVLIRADQFEIQYLSDPRYRLEDDYSEATDAYRGKSVLFLDANELKKDIERKYPYARVLKVEKNVSRTVIVKLAERYEYFWTETETGYAVLDRDLKVLRVGEGEPQPIEGEDAPGLIRVVFPEKSVLSAVPGQTLQVSKQFCTDFLRAFVSGVEPYAANEMMARQPFGRIDLEFGALGEHEDSILVYGRSGCEETVDCGKHFDADFEHGCLFHLLSASENPEAFLDKLFSCFYDELDEQSREGDLITLRADESGKVYID